MTWLRRAVRERPGWLMAVLVLAWGGASLVWGERLPRNDGFGWDGETYRIMAQRLPEPIPELSAYNGRRCLPSLVARAELLACGAAPTGPNVLAAFAATNVALNLGTLAALLACGRTLGLGAAGRWVLFVGFFANYAHLKHYHYAPVQTDVWATALAALLVLAYLRRWPGVVLAAGAVGAFVWPVLPHLAALLFLLPARAVRPERPLGVPAPVPAFGRELGAFAALSLLAVLAYVIRVERYTGVQEGQTLESLLPLSCVLMAVYVYLALPALLAPEPVPDVPPAEGRAGAGFVLRLSASRSSGVLAAVTRRDCVGFAGRLACVVLAFHALSLVDAHLRSIFQAPNPFAGTRAYIRAILYHGVSRPLLFAVTNVIWFGPVVVLAACDWARVCQGVRGAGTGLVLYVAAGLLLSLGGEARQALTVFPVVALFAARAADRRGWSAGRVAAFGAVALLASRVWLPLNPVPWPAEDRLYEYPMQRMFMSCGYSTTASYLFLGAVAAATLVAVVMVVRPAPRPPRSAQMNSALVGPQVSEAV